MTTPRLSWWQGRVESIKIKYKNIIMLLNTSVCTHIGVFFCLNDNDRKDRRHNDLPTV